MKYFYGLAGGGRKRKETRTPLQQQLTVTQQAVAYPGG